MLGISFGSVQGKQPEKWNLGDWFLPHDNAPARCALSVHEILTKKKMTLILYLPYSPDVAQCDFFHFQKLEMVLKGRKPTITMMQAKLWDVLANFLNNAFHKML